MTSGDLISLLGYYIGILAIALAFFASQIESWKSKVHGLSMEWSESDQKADTQVRLKQTGQKNALKSSKPLFSILAPFVLGVVLLYLGYIASQRTTCAKAKDFFYFLLLPGIGLLVLYLVYGVASLCAGIRKLNRL
jgi:hypothetical protein